jgi:hypothetical protein
MSNQVATFTTKKIDTAPLKITIAIPPENPKIKGYFTGHAILRSKVENKELFDRIDAGEVEDEQLVRECYESFDGLGNAAGYCEGEAAFVEILTGPNSAYLTPAVIQAYYEQYGEARQKNFKRSRGR